MALCCTWHALRFAAHGNTLCMYTDSLSLPSNEWQQLTYPGPAPPPRTYHVLVTFAEALVIHGTQAPPFITLALDFDVTTSQAASTWTWLEGTACFETPGASHF